MKKTSYLFAAMMLAALGSGFSPVTVNAVQAQEAADPAKQQTVRPEMGKPLNEIQDLLNAKQYPQALEKINAMDAALEKKTPFELFTIHRFRAVVASSINDSALMASSFEYMISTDFLKDPEKQRLTEAMASMFFGEKKYAQSRVWAERFLAKAPGNEVMANLIARTYYIENDFANTIKVVNAQIAEDDKAKRNPSSDNLKLLYSAYQQLKDWPNYALALERLVALYPTPEYWAGLIYSVTKKPGFSERMQLDYYRLLLLNDKIEDAADFVDMAELALLAGSPAEAKAAMDAGYAANVLGTGKEAAKQKQLRDRVNKQAADDIKSLDAGEAAAKNAKTGIGLVNIGYNYIVNGQYDKGLTLMEQGIAKGGLKYPEEAKLHLGMAYLKAGKRDKAAEILKSVKGSDGSADFARLWLLVPANKFAPEAK
ncbi:MULTISPECIES: tetratricopeptide repeat protein [unclassified Undibacterium]|uniref:tetratricopeptide repeat protein n=1 Tax=unclassified Undibacterium TaxID=2630295 RepID=UPI001331E868|nr:hypothetical protein [Undibacterium sp. YM2]BBB64311.1 hypothetical protein UNDYM_0058 [Undibacterium sp. YM2]